LTAGPLSESLEKQTSITMKKEMSNELEKIKAAALALGARLHSDDQKIAEQAMTELKAIGGEFEAWAKKSNVSLTRHTEEAPETRRRCAPWISTVINGKIQACVLLGKERRNCLYSCAPATMVPT
jgi:hypothetical protein